MGTGTNRIGYDFGLSNGVICVHLNKTHISNAIRLSGSARSNNNVYHHLAISYNGNSNAGGFAVYADGVNIASQITVYENSLTGSTRNTFPLTIGSRRNGSDLYAGTIDDVRVWSVERSRTQITANYLSVLSGLKNNLIAYYKFDNDSLINAVDFGTLGLNGPKN